MHPKEQILPKILTRSAEILHNEQNNITPDHSSKGRAGKARKNQTKPRLGGLGYASTNSYPTIWGPPEIDSVGFGRGSGFLREKPGDP